MPRVPYIYPPEGLDAIADCIRARRGTRGLSPLDATLLNAPEIAEGWNRLIGTLRTGNSLPGHIRELMILRIAALNGAAFEWLHHEHPGRAEGLTTAHLAAIIDTSRVLSSVFSPLQNAAIAFTDASTNQARVPDEVFDGLKHQLRTHALLEPTVDKHPTRVEDRVNRQLVEAAALVGGYNLVSRFLLALDVDDCASAPLPFVPPPAGSPDIHEYPVTVEPGVRIHIRVQFHHDAPKAPVLIFVNSLLTNRSMWDHVLPFFADKYTLISFDQRGHGKSTMPLPSDLLFSNSSSQYPPPSPAPITIKRLAQDVGFILDYLNFPRIHGIVGVSQGGATALSFAMQYPHRALRVVACDTQAAAPLSNRDAWESRIAVARGSGGMEELARQTAVRWFPSGSSFRAPALDAAEQRDSKDWDTLREMIAGTSIEGFAASARSLQAYDLRAEGLISTLQSVTSGEGVKENAMKVLLLAGSEDGKLPGSLKALRDEIGTENAQFTEIVGSGHLPMLDQPEEFARVLDEFLA